MRKLPLVLLFVFLAAQSFAVGTWTKLVTTLPYNYGAQMNLLSDGTAMIHLANGGGDNYGNAWVRLTPDIHGSYVNGTITTLAPMHYTRLDFSAQILKDGRLYVAGGEYGTGLSNGEVYNPLTNTWTDTPLPGNTISDANSEILEDGRVLQSLVGATTGIVIYDPITNTYSPGPSTLGRFKESSWVKLADNSILYVDQNVRTSERYIPSLNKWIADGTVPVDLYDPYGSEAGAGLLLPDGRAFFLGSTGTTAIYTPTGDTTKGTWVAGPTIPNTQGTPDAPAAMMVNGKILCVVSPLPTSANHFPTPMSYYEYDYVANAFTRVNAPAGGTTTNNPSWTSNMLLLPDGSVLYGQQSSGNTVSRNMYIYTPDGTPQASGKPKIVNIVQNTNGSYTMTGTLFNGITEGATYGDDEQMNTNYPIVRLTSGTNVYYARTFNWNSTGLMRGNRPDTTTFTLPTGLPPTTTYSLVVTANGISSDPVSFTPATFSSVGKTDRNGFQGSGLHGFSATSFGSMLNLHFRLELGTPDQNALTLQLTKVDGQTVYEEKIPASGDFNRQIDLHSHGNGLYLFVLSNGKNRISRWITVQ
ncbi:MAG TPA: hypothetical protein DCQ83_07540 [Fibrobacteres bacterium]|jgi:hypothetical protein|nr:hypothetical protein [Fibrobacterota bacterium]